MSTGSTTSAKVSTVSETHTSSNIESEGTERTSTGSKCKNYNHLTKTNSTRTNIADNNSAKDVSNNQVIVSSKKVQKFVQNNHKLPNYVSVNGNKIKMNEFLYLVSQTLVNINNKNYEVHYLELPKQSINTNDKISGTLTKNQYLSLCKSNIEFIKNNNAAPDTRGTSLGIMQFKSMVYHLSTVLNTYSTTGKLPNSLKVDDSVFETPIKVSAAGPIPIKFTVAQLSAAGNTIADYVKKNKKLPNSVTIGSKKINMAEFLYLASKATYRLNKGNNGSVVYVKMPAMTKTNNKNVKGQWNKTDYVSTAKSIVSYMDSHKKAPLSMKTKIGTAQFRSLTFTFAKALVFYKDNHRLANYMSVDDSAFKNKSTHNNTNSLTLSEIYNASNQIRSYIESNGKLPNSIVVNNKKVIMADFLDVFSQTVVKFNNNETVKEIALRNLTNNKFNSSNFVYGDINKADYVKLANDIESYINSNKKTPNVLDTSLGKMQFRTMIYTLTRVITFYEQNSRLANYVSTSDAVFSDSNSTLKQYLVATKNCQVNNAKIKNLASSLVAGLKSNWSKAEKIFNYVRDTITYSFYFNTKRGALNTLNSKLGNCVDTAHLVIALCRAANLPARYVHADCTFRSGNVIGHVWAEINIGGKWIEADGTSKFNKLGKTVNWSRAVLHNRYIELPF